MTSGQPYLDRREAGRILAAHIREQTHLTNPIILALPRGGVPVGFEVAQVLDAPLDVFLVRKLPAPDRPEFTIGAIASGGYELLDEPMITRLGLDPLHVAEVADRETSEMRRREAIYRAGRPPHEISGHDVLLVDDGLATGLTMRAATGALREYGVRRLIVAAPVGSKEACVELGRQADVVICPFLPEPFHSVGLWYRNFEPVGDREVQEFLAAAALNREAAHA